ncbi:MAG: lysophospholipid acyltransferase family protein [Janthinobacterium lividum]
MNKIKHFLLDCCQTFMAFILILFFLCLSFEKASNLAGALGRWIGRRFKPYRTKADQNLKRAMPELSDKKRQEIMDGMFDNLMRTMTEYCKIYQLKIYDSESRVEVVGADIIDQLRDDQQPAILFLGHLANWEIGTMAGLQRGLNITQVYRKLNYPMLDRLINFMHKWVAQDVVAKGPEGSRRILKALKEGRHVSILMDQKLNEGEWVPFFGMPAKTAITGARLALKNNCPFVPVRVERLDGTRFRVTYYPPLKSLKATPQDQLMDLLNQMNQLLESWIRARPEQWLWIHNRWPRGHKK